RERWHDGAAVGEWLAHAHEHDVGDGTEAMLGRPAPGAPELADDLAWCELAPVAGPPRRAEDARHRAARLGRDAERESVARRDQHGLDELAVLQPPEVLDRAIGGARRLRERGRA